MITFYQMINHNLSIYLWHDINLSYIKFEIFHSEFLFSVKFTKMPFPASTQSSENNFALSISLSEASSISGATFSLFKFSLFFFSLSLLLTISSSESSVVSGKILFKVSGKIKANAPDPKQSIPIIINGMVSGKYSPLKWKLHLLLQNEYFKEKAEIRVESYLIFPIPILYVPLINSKIIAGMQILPIIIHVAYINCRFSRKRCINLSKFLAQLLEISRPYTSMLWKRCSLLLFYRVKV